MKERTVRAIQDHGRGARLDLAELVACLSWVGSDQTANIFPDHLEEIRERMSALQSGEAGLVNVDDDLYVHARKLEAARLALYGIEGMGIEAVGCIGDILAEVEAGVTAARAAVRDFLDLFPVPAKYGALYEIGPVEPETTETTNTTTPEPCNGTGEGAI